MVRLIALFAVLATLVGCRSPQTFENPFMGRTTVAPPGTAVPGTLPGAYDPNAATAPPFDPNTAAPGAAAPATLFPTNSAPAGAAPAGLPKYEPAGGFDFRQSQVAPPATSQYGTPGTIVTPVAPPPFQPQGMTSPSGARWGSPAASSATSPIAAGVAQHDASTGQLSQASAVLPSDRRAAAPANAAFARDSAGATGAATSATGQKGLAEPGRLPTDNNAVDIMALPPAGAPKQAQRASPTVERTSYMVPVDSSESSATSEQAGAERAADPAIKIKSGPAPTAPTKSINHASYGHDPNYAWLKGRLDYSNIDRRWKLRYIPIDGQTDSHGGSVMLSESSLLAGFASGDFIAVQGTLGGRSSNGFAPEYELSRVKRLEQ